MRRRWLALAVALTVALLLTARLFVWPETNRPADVDAVIVLAGGSERLSEGLRLMDRGSASVLVVSHGAELFSSARPLCLGGRPYEVICPTPKPLTTRGEARTIAALASERGWRSLTVVTSTHHVTRARLLFERCFEGDVAVVGARPDGGLLADFRSSGHEWVGLMEALVITRDC